MNATSYFKDVKTVFLHRWNSLSGALSIIGTIIVVYGFIYFLKGDMPNPIWMVWWALSGSYGTALAEVGYERYTKFKEGQLAKAKENTLGTVEIYTLDDVKIGEIEEDRYLDIKHQVDLCWHTTLLQALNYIWVVWCIAVRLLRALPILLIFLFIGFSMTMSHDQLLNITIGRILVMFHGSWAPIFYLLGVAVLIVLVMYTAMGYYPGYKNFYGLRLKRLLAKYVPQYCER